MPTTRTNSLNPALERVVRPRQQALIHEIGQRLEALAGLKSAEFSALVEHLAESGFDGWLRTDPHCERITEQVLVDMRELLKEQTAVKGWQHNYD